MSDARKLKARNDPALMKFAYSINNPLTHTPQADMLIHHLTIVQTKCLFVTRDMGAVWVNRALNPIDAYAYGLTPLLVLSLTVEKVGIYHQRVYFKNEPISIADFLHDAWSNDEFLKGLPDELGVDQQLLDVYPLTDALKQIDPEGHIKKVTPNPGRTFSSIKGHANVRVRDALNFPRMEPAPKPDSHAQLISVLNTNLEHRIPNTMFDFHTGTPAFLQAREAHILRTHRKPSDVPPQPAFAHFDLKWVLKTSISVEKLNKHQAITPSPTEGWINFLEIGYVHDPDDEDEHERAGIMDERPDCYSWVSEMFGIKELIDVLPFDIDLPTGLSADQLRGFLTGREALKTSLAKRLEASVLMEPKVLWPRSINGVREALYHAANGEAERGRELVSGDEQWSNFRVMAFISDSAGLILVVIAKGTKANVPDVESILDIRGRLNIGAVGFAALTFWLENHIKGCPSHNSFIFLNMVDKMLGTVLEWRDS